MTAFSNNTSASLDLDSNGETRENLSVLIFNGSICFFLDTELYERMVDRLVRTGIHSGSDNLPVLREPCFQVVSASILG